MKDKSEKEIKFMEKQMKIINKLILKKENYASKKYYKEQCEEQEITIAKYIDLHNKQKNTIDLLKLELNNIEETYNIKNMSDRELKILKNNIEKELFKRAKEKLDKKCKSI